MKVIRILVLLTIVILLVSCASTSKEHGSSIPPGKSDQLSQGITVPGVYHGGKLIPPEKSDKIIEGETTKQEVVALLGKPTLETSACDGGILMSYHHLSEKTRINPINVMFYGALGAWVLSYQNVERKRDVVWILIGPDNRVSKAARYSDYGEYSISTIQDEANLFDGNRHTGFPIHFVSDPPGARIEWSEGFGFRPYRRGPAVVGNAPYAPFFVSFAKIPALPSILKQWRFRAVWKDTGRKSRTVFLRELYACPRDFVFRPKK